MPVRIVSLLACASAMFALTGGLPFGATNHGTLAASRVAGGTDAAGTLDVAWSVELPIVPAVPSPVQFAVCPDGSTIVWNTPGILHRIATNGAVTARQHVDHLHEVRSLDCGRVVRLLTLRGERLMDLVELDPRRLTERRRAPLAVPGAYPGVGLRELAGDVWVLGPASDGLLLARLTEGVMPDTRIVQVPQAWRFVPLPAAPLPLVFRASTGQFLLARDDVSPAADYAVMAFDRQGTLHRVWRRASAEMVPGVQPRGPRVLPGAGPARPIGLALLADETLVVQVPGRTRGGARGQIELVDPSWQIIGTWSLPDHGLLFGADQSGALYFAHVRSDAVHIWKSRPVTF